MQDVMRETLGSGWGFIVGIVLAVIIIAISKRI